MKITVVGAGNVGATCADVLAYREIANEIVLVDIKEGLAEGKALDIWQKAPINQYDSRSIGSTSDYAKSAGSEVVVITSGLPRKPGMSRDDLIGTNAGIVKTVTENVIKHSPEAIIIVVSNPLDVMTYQAHLTSKLPRTRVMGMAGILDTARYRAFLAEALNVSPKDIQAVLMGGHGDTMVPLPRYTTVAGIPVTELIASDNAEDSIDALIDLCVVAIGTLDLFFVNAHKAWDEVHGCNMNKRSGIKASRPNPLGLPDLMKPEGWVGPSHENNHVIMDLVFDDK